MFKQPVKLVTQKTRKESAEAINHAMARFPLLVEILGDLSKASIPFPGDDDIRHGCERALTAMLAELARIEPASTGRTSKAEETALGWLHSLESEKLIHPDQRQRIQQFIERILGGAAHTL